MTKADFIPIMAYIGTAIGKPIGATKEEVASRTEVYFDLLGDLPAHTLQVAAKRVVLEHKWATFPTVAELRQAASETIRGQVSGLSSAEAWGLAWDAVKRIDLDIEETIQRACEGLPPLVVEAMRAFGITALVTGKEPISVVRGQFLKVYEQLQARDQRQALLPNRLKADIAKIGQANPKIEATILQIGKQVS